MKKDLKLNFSYQPMMNLELELSPEGEIWGFNEFGFTLFGEDIEYKYEDTWFYQEVIGKDGRIQKLKTKKTKDGNEITISVNGKKLLKAEKRDTDGQYYITEIWLHKTKTIHDNAFAFSSVEKIHFSDCLRSIGNEAFAHSSLKEVDIPSGVKIGKGAFDDCPELRKKVVAWAKPLPGQKNTQNAKTNG